MYKLLAWAMLLPITLVGCSKPETTPTSAETVDANKAAESDIVSECDLAVRSSLISQSSYDPEFGWKFIPGDPRSEVLRHYDATNAFGGTVTSIYDCKYNNAAKRIVSLQTASPLGSRTLIADPADQKATHHHRWHHHRS